MNNQKIVLITGVSREMGLGFAMAKKFSDNNFQVIITARDINKVNDLALKLNVIAMQLDVSDDNSVEKLATEISSNYGKLDVLINNAAHQLDFGGQPLSTDLNYAKEVLDTNLFGAWRMAKAFVSLLKKSEAGRIVNVGSAAGSFTDSIFGLDTDAGNFTVYGISKVAINGLTVKLARELKDTKIKVNSACPGFVATYEGMIENGAKPVSEGAESIYWAATISDDGPSGGFFRNGQKLDW
jgi:NAD(P)-dependent dehydrogenase (short-subunit alcohol dehydrogenase family)